MITDHAWVPRATCDASCVRADAAGQPVVVAWRIAVRATTTEWPAAASVCTQLASHDARGTQGLS